MSVEDTKLAALIGSRICHDIISPIGAINNGLELLELSGEPMGPETQLIQESCHAAQARISFFRVAYGAAGDRQMIAARQASGVLAALNKTGKRHSFAWRVVQDMPRSEVQLAFLGIQCMETGLPAGGRVDVHFEGERWRLQVSEGEGQFDDPLWSLLQGGAGPQDIRPEHVQFALLSNLLDATGRRATLVTEGPKPALVI